MEKGVCVSPELLCAKSRVAPVKQVTLPRLELSAATLLAELMDYVSASLNVQDVQKRFYSDSQVVLTWIKSESRVYKVFVANRAGEIQRLTNADAWYHIPGASNPADLISRGVSASDLRGSKLWWHGPEEIRREPREQNFVSICDATERKCVMVNALTVVPEYSTFRKTIRVFGYVLRFIDDTRNIERRRGELPAGELKSAARVVIRLVQRDAFKELLRHDKTPQGLKMVNPFIDEEGLVRVGGRLAGASALEFDTRCPILLPRSHHLTRIIIREIHEKEMHAGVHGTLGAVRQQYWPVRGKSTVQGIVRSCIRCIRCRPTFETPLMGWLPDVRITPTHPFLRSGVDYAGPLLLKEGGRRSKRYTKAFVCIFTCFSTKAAHLELVSDLTTEAFMAALNRFIGRRGIVQHLYSDNATNFQGAANKLRKLSLFFQEETNKTLIVR